MRVLTLNCNGIRSASRKGMYEWLAKQSADVICLQETRAAEVDLSGKEFSLKGYRAEHVHASRRGYSGVSAYWRERAARVVRGFGSREFDDEGRYLELQFPELSVVSVYFPSGSSGPERQAAKFRFLEQFRAHLAALRRRRRHYIVCGDLNIAHRNVDIKNWRGNQKNSGFLPEERAWLDDVFGGGGYADAFRLVNQDAGQYTWWSHRGQAWTKNVGWRIDYQVVSAGLADRVRGASIWKQSRFSDHAPLIIDYADGL